MKKIKLSKLANEKLQEKEMNSLKGGILPPAEILCKCPGANSTFSNYVAQMDGE